MPVPCEVAVKSVIPAVRAYIAKELTQTHNMKQTDIAYALGITQTAVSKYISNVRGQAIRIDQTAETKNMAKKIASMIAKEKISGPQLTMEFCQVCRTVRRKGLMCHLCERFGPTLKNTSCDICRIE